MLIVEVRLQVINLQSCMMTGSNRCQPLSRASKRIWLSSSLSNTGMGGAPRAGNITCWYLVVYRKLCWEKETTGWPTAEQLVTLWRSLSEIKQMEAKWRRFSRKGPNFTTTTLHPRSSHLSTRGMGPLSDPKQYLSTRYQ